MKKCCLPLVLLLLVQPLFADEISDATEMIEKEMDKVLTILKNKELKEEEKNEKVEEIVELIFNFPLIAKLTLGRKHWSRLSKEEQKKFIELLTKLLKGSYLKKLELFMDVKVKFEPGKKVGTKIHVPASVDYKDETISVLYKLHKSDERWRIYDVEIRGVSLVSTYRSQYDEHFRNGGTVAELLEKIEKKNDTDTPPER